MTDLPPTRLRPPAAWKIWNNPIFRRYCRSRLRSRGLGVSLVLTLVITGFIYLLVPAINKRWNERKTQEYDRFITQLEVRAAKDHNIRNLELPKFLTERATFASRGESYFARLPILWLLGAQAVILLLLGSGQVAGGNDRRIGRRQRDYQRLVPMSPLAKTLGYLFGLPIREYIMFLSTLPLTALCLWKGEVPASDWLPRVWYFPNLRIVVSLHWLGLRDCGEEQALGVPALHGINFPTLHIGATRWALWIPLCEIPHPLAGSHRARYSDGTKVRPRHDGGHGNGGWDGGSFLQCKFL